MRECIEFIVIVGVFIAVAAARPTVAELILVVRAGSIRGSASANSRLHGQRLLFVVVIL